MKKTNITLLICAAFIFAFGTEANAQNLKESDVPSEVKAKFSTMYPQVSNAKWEKENGKYEAEFKENGTETSVLFEANGTHVQTEVEIPVSSLPSSVSAYISKNLPGKTITEAVEITTPAGTVSYEAEVGNEDYLFDGSGKYIGKDNDSNDTEDDDKDNK